MMRRILAALLLALTLGVLVPAAGPAFAGRGDVDSFGSTRN
jgi:hypothetical protein